MEQHTTGFHAHMPNLISITKRGNISETFHHDLKWKETFSQQLEQNHIYVCLNVHHID